jgi:hypothetical protein
MDRNNQLSASPQFREATALKGTSRQVIIRAIKRGEIDTLPVGKRFVVKANKGFKEWQLSERHQQAGNARWRKK